MTFLINLDKDCLTKWNSFLLETNINTNKSLNVCKSKMLSLLDFIKDFYDDREETEKDRWYSKNIKRAKLNATSNRKSDSLNFNDIPVYYRDTVKRYFITIITKKGWSHCFNILTYLRYFFNYFYSNAYNDGFIENLLRQDIENFIFSFNEHRNIAVLKK